MQEETTANVNNVPGLLKAFVILGGVILVIGAILLAVMLVMRAAGSGGSDPPARGLVSSGPVDLALPADVRVNQVVVEG
ncbi:MAG: hypothetical protein OEU92_16360, partial [Alphaproteobacteria bacterium]|nr:hypothetical protein [Alphaproteobacteria bacterium]